MFEHDYLVSEPLFWLFIAATAVLVWGYYWGEKENKRIYISAFNALVDIIKPLDQTFTNIGGLIGYHGNFVTSKDSPIEKVEATITFLARQSLLYLPVSILIRKHDRLFITLHLRQSPKEEGHLIEERYSRYRHARITNEARLKRETTPVGRLQLPCVLRGQPDAGPAEEVHGEPCRSGHRSPHRHRSRTRRSASSS